jgi:nitroreductase
MNTLKALMSRRSIRKFKNAPITDNQIKVLLECAMQAPSAGDGRPWHFVVIRDRQKLNAIADKIDGGNEMFKEAQVAILIIADPSKEGFPGFYPQDCSCAAQNLQLAAHDLGLGTVWIALWSVKPRLDGLNEIIKIPENLKPFAIFPIGVPAEDLGEDYRYDENRIHIDKW